MPGGLPGGGMLKLRFDWYITNGPMCYVAISSKVISGIIFDPQSTYFTNICI